MQVLMTASFMISFKNGEHPQLHGGHRTLNHHSNRRAGHCDAEDSGYLGAGTAACKVSVLAAVLIQFITGTSVARPPPPLRRALNALS